MKEPSPLLPSYPPAYEAAVFCCCCCLSVLGRDQLAGEEGEWIQEALGTD